jgi:hypothetical protein
LDNREYSGSMAEPDGVKAKHSKPLNAAATRIQA